MQETTPLLSVIIPTFNRAEFVRECLRSLQEGGVDSLEIIVVDDGGTDDTEQVVRETEPRAHYIRQTNAGPAAARNNGFRHSRGQLVTFLDSDDAWLPGQMGRVAVWMQKYPLIDVLFADARMGNPQEGFTSWIEVGGESAFFALPHWELEPGLRRLEREPFFRRMAVRNAVFLGATMIRREVLERYGLFDEQLCGAADWNLWLRLSARCTFGFWQEPVAIYTKHAGGMSNDQDGMSREFCEALRRLPDQLTLDREESRWVAQRLRHHLYGYAYNAYHRGEFHEARLRFANVIRTSGFDFRSGVYWLFCCLPGSLARRLRGFKHFLRGETVELAARPKVATSAVLPAQR